MSFNDYPGRRTGDDPDPAGSGQRRGLSGYATGATARGKQALVPAAWLQFPYLPRDQYELGLEAGLLDATYPLDYTDYLRTVEDVLGTHVREYKVRLIPLTIAGLREFATAAGLDPARRSTRMAYLNAMGADAPVLPWPPGRNARCWCGSGAKYKKCCGSPGFTQTPVPDRARCVLRIEVDGGEPGDARRVAVPSELRTDELRDVLNRALGLDGDPLYRFEIDGGYVSDPRAVNEGDVQTAEQVTLSMLANEPGHSFTYRHDPDHGRVCNVMVEEITAVDPAGNDVVFFGDEPGPDRSSQTGEPPFPAPDVSRRTLYR